MARIKTTKRRKTAGIQPSRSDTRVVGHTTLRPGSATDRLRKLLEQAEVELFYREDIQSSRIKNAFKYFGLGQVKLAIDVDNIAIGRSTVM